MSTRERIVAVENSIGARFRRVRQRLLAAIQVGIAAGLAYFIAHEWVGHPQPFFAPISVVIIVGISGGERINRAFDMALGCILGVLVGDFLFAPLGTGGWQIALAVGVSLLFAGFFSKSVLVANQVAIGSILIATIMPPDADVTGIDRTIDAFIGSAVGLAVIALLPSAPLATARHEISNVLRVLSSVLNDVSHALLTQDPTQVAEALSAIRGTQNDIEAITAATKSGRESARLSPFLWRSRRYVDALEKMVTPTDNAIRTTRVLARRALVLAEDNDPVSPKQIWILDQLSAITLDLAAILDVNAKISQAQGVPALTNRLRDLAAEAGLDVLDPSAQPPAGVPESVFSRPDCAGLDSVDATAASASGGDGEDGGEDAQMSSVRPGFELSSRPALSAAVVLAQSRSLIVDMLQICGWSRESAIAVLAPTSETPAYEPDLREAPRQSGSGSRADGSGDKE